MADPSAKHPDVLPEEPIDRNDPATGVAARRAMTERNNEQAMRRDALARPTPTQEENDLAKVGILDPMQPKADHGAEPESESFRKDQMRKLEAMQPAPGGYETRDVGGARRNETPEQREERERREREQAQQQPRGRVMPPPPQPKT